MHVIKTQENIITMRESGCSYGQIAKTLNIPKSTVSSFCLDHGVKPPVPRKAPLTAKSSATTVATYTVTAPGTPAVTLPTECGFVITNTVKKPPTATTNAKL